MSADQLSERDREARRHCLVTWPEAVAGEYNPSCCRFPKSCSCPPPEGPSPSTQSREPRARWVKAKQVRVGDEVLCIGGWLRVTHSEKTTGDSEAWMLRFEHGVDYFNPRAPIAARTPR